MEAAFTKFRTVIAVVATIVISVAMIQAVAPGAGAGDPARMPGVGCPPDC